MNSIEKLRNELDARCKDGLVPLSQTRELWSFIDEIKREVEERYVELPTDADGAPIHIGDKITEGGYSAVHTVKRMNFFSEDGWSIHTDIGFIEQPENAVIHHYQPPTVEDVLEKALNKAASLDRNEGYWPSAADITNIVNEIAPKLQLREED